MELTKNMDKENFSKWLQIELDRRGWNQAELSRKSGLSTGQIARLMSGERGLGENSVKAIASALRIPANLVYQAAGFLQTTSEADTWLEEQTHKMSLLTPDKRPMAEKLLNALLEEDKPAVHVTKKIRA